LVETRFDTGGPDRLEHADRSHPGGIGGVLGDLEADLHVALGPQVVDLVGLEVADQVHERTRVREIPVVHEEADALLVGVAVDLVEALGVERRRPPDQAVDLVAFPEEQLGEVRAVLAGNAGDEGRLHRLRICSLRFLHSGPRNSDFSGECPHLAP
jgi:hypothetical protein